MKKTIKLFLIFILSSNILVAQTSFDQTTNYYRHSKIVDLITEVYYSKVPSNKAQTTSPNEFRDNSPFLYKSIDSISGSYKDEQNPYIYAKGWLILTFDKSDSLIQIKIGEISALRKNQSSTTISILDDIVFVDNDKIGFTWDEIEKMKAGIRPTTKELLRFIFESTRKRKFKKPRSFPEEDFTDKNVTVTPFTVNNDTFFKNNKEVDSIIIEL